MNIFKPVYKLLRILQPVIWIVILAAMGTFYYLASSLDIKEHEQTVTALRSLKQEDAILIQNFLRARYYYDRTYDPLNASLFRLRSSVEYLGRDKHKIFHGDSEMLSAFEEYQNIFERRKEILNQFKASNAILRNSLYYLPQSKQKVENKVRHQNLLDNLLRDILLYNLSGNDDLVDSINQQLKGLIQLQKNQSATTRDEIDILRRHAENIMTRKQELDGLIKETVQSNSSTSINRLMVAYQQWFIAAEYKASIFQLLLFVLAFTLLLYIGLVIIKLKLAGYSLSEANRSLRKFNEAADRFVPHRLLQFLGRRDIREVRLGDCRRENMTVLFSDIRSFTNFSEGMSPEDNFAFINSYLSEMGPIIQRHNGFIDKYIGDAIMALFGSSPVDAVNAAIAMLANLKVYNKTHRSNRDPIEIGIGLHAGEMMLGTIGESTRMEGTVISDAVNLASRIESLTKAYQVPLLISEDIKDKLNLELHHVRFVDKVTVKGRQGTAKVYEVYDYDSPDLRRQKTEVAPLIVQACNLGNKGNYIEARATIARALELSPVDGVLLFHKERLAEPVETG